MQTTTFMKQNADWKIAHAYDARERINLRPEYQRNLVWLKATKQRLIWCMLRGQDIPKIFFHVQGTGDNIAYDTIDGQQRLDAIFDFRDGEFSLANKAKDIDGVNVGGMYYADLPEGLQQRFDSYSIQVTEIYTDDVYRVIDQFLDLQRGKRLNGQERRFAPPGFIKELVLELGNHPFINLTRINNRREKKYEVVSRLVIWEYENAIVDTRSEVLDRFYLEHANDNDQMKVWKSLILNMVSTLDELLRIFEKYHSSLRSVNNLLLTYWLWRNVRKQYLVKQYDYNDFLEWFNNFFLFIKAQSENEKAEKWLQKWSSSTNTANANNLRYKLMLQNFLIAFPELVARDARRHFTEEQRMVIFNRAGGRCQWIDNSNQECGHKFAWSDEWDADHIINHADGGLTTLDNGRLLCAYRNRANGNGQSICPLMQKA